MRMVMGTWVWLLFIRTRVAPWLSVRIVTHCDSFVNYFKNGYFM